MAGLRALVDPIRLRILARLATRPAEPETLAEELRQPMPTIARQLDALAAAGLVERRPAATGRYAARMDRVGALARELAILDTGPGAVSAGSDAGGLLGAWPHDGEPPADTLARLALTPEEARTLRAYLVDGRLRTIPAQHRKRDVVLRFLLERVFTEDREYPEKEVNQRLALFHADVASLRRYLVDEGFATRKAGRYRRVTTGGHPPQEP